MATRSSTNIAIITMLSVLVLVLIGLFALQNSSLNALREEHAKLDRKAKDLDKRLGDVLDEKRGLEKLIAGEGPMPEISTARERLADAAKPLAAALNIKEPVPYDNFLDFAANVGEAVRILTQQVDKADAEAQNRATEYQKLQEAHRKQLEIKSANYNALAEKRDQLQSRVEELSAQLIEQKREDSKKLTDCIDERENLQIALGRQIKTLQAQKARLTARLEEVTKEKVPEITFDQVEPDGRIIAVADPEGYAFIDRGRRHHVQAGMEFEVFQILMGGKRIPKGRVRVSRVEEDRSRVLVLSVLDPRNPIVEGDRITSPFYDPRRTPVFVFAGSGLRSKEATQEYVLRKLKEYRVRVDEDVTPQTDFLVPLKDYETDPRYQKARELKVVMLREDELLRFLGLRGAGAR